MDPSTDLTPHTGWIAAILGAWFAPTPNHCKRWLAMAYNLLRGNTMPNLMTLIPVAIKFVTLAYQLEQVETSTTLTAVEKREAALVILPQLEPLIDSAAGLPAGKVEEYLTPAVLAMLYDGAVFAESKLA